jgi:hypothetical protein
MRPTQELADRLGAWIDGRFFTSAQEADDFFADVFNRLVELAMIEEFVVETYPDCEVW